MYMRKCAHVHVLLVIWQLFVFLFSFGQSCLLLVLCVYIVYWYVSLPLSVDCFLSFLFLFSLPFLLFFSVVLYVP